MIEVTKRPYDISFSGNPVHYELTSESAQQNPDNYFETRLKFRTPGGQWQTLPVLPFTPVDGVAHVNVQDLVHAQLSWNMPTLTGDQTAVQTVSGHTGEFYLEFREITPNITNPAWVTSESDHTRVVIRGGVNYFKWQGNNFWVNYFDMQKPFLTWQQNGRLAGVDEPMWLTWLNRWVTSNNMEFRITVYYTDGTSYYTGRSFASAVGDCHFLPCGSQLNLASLNPAKRIHYWQCQVLDQNDGGAPYSQPFRYYMDNRTDYNHQVLHYRNSLGGVDSVRVRGVIETVIDYTFQEQEQAHGPSYFAGNVVTAQKTHSYNRELPIKRGDIGHLTKEEQDRLRDINVQRELYQIAGTKWWPVLLLTKSLKLRITTDNRWSMPIEWQLATTGNTWFTPDGVDLGGGADQSNVCLAKITGVMITRVFGGTDCTITFTGSETDPDDVSTQFRYRILPTYDWQTVNTSTMPISKVIPTGVGRTLELQGICNPGGNGAIQNIYFDTITPAPVNSPGGLNNATLTNHTVNFVTITIKGWDSTNNLVFTFTDYIEAGQTKPFNVPGLFNYKNIELTTSGWVPNSGKMTIFGQDHQGVVDGAKITWLNKGVDGAGGCEFHIY